MLDIMADVKAPDEPFITAISGNSQDGISTIALVMIVLVVVIIVVGAIVIVQHTGKKKK